jgi:acyl-CoA thioester hydrolase
VATDSDYNLNIRVYYEDTDAGGIVYHANYLKFFERARTEWFRELGIDQDKLLQQNIAFLIRHVEVDYHLPARFNALLTVNCKISKLRKASLNFQQTITNGDGQLICTGDYIVACVDLDRMKAVQFPANITEVLNVVI